MASLRANFIIQTTLDIFESEFELVPLLSCIQDWAYTDRGRSWRSRASIVKCSHIENTRVVLWNLSDLAHCIEYSFAYPPFFELAKDISSRCRLAYGRLQDLPTVTPVSKLRLLMAWVFWSCEPGDSCPSRSLHSCECCLVHNSSGDDRSTSAARCSV